MAGTTVCTDSLMSYDDLERDYDRQVVDHLECYARGQVPRNRAARPNQTLSPEKKPQNEVRASPCDDRIPAVGNIRESPRVSAGFSLGPWRAFA
jgi:hypothetical protein